MSVCQLVGPSVWGHKVEKWENVSIDIFSCGMQRLQSFICRSVGPSICWSVEVMESKSGKMSVLKAFCVSVCVGKGVKSFIYRFENIQVKFTFQYFL